VLRTLQASTGYDEQPADLQAWLHRIVTIIV
jgi:hypothetical protein